MSPADAWGPTWIGILWTAVLVVVGLVNGALVFRRLIGPLVLDYPTAIFSLLCSSALMVCGSAGALAFHRFGSAAAGDQLVAWIGGPGLLGFLSCAILLMGARRRAAERRSGGVRIERATRTAAPRRAAAGSLS